MQVDPQIRAQFLPDTLVTMAQPAAYVMAGIPAAGKSTYVDAMQDSGAFPNPAFIMDPDRVMQAMPSYQTALKTDAQAAFEAHEISARQMAYAMFQEAAECQFPIIKDMGCTRLENITKVGMLKDLGYQIHVHAILVDVETSWQRIQKRARFTPKDMVLRREAGLQETLPMLKDLADSYQEIKTD